VDVTTTVDRPDLAEVARMAAPLLKHPTLRGLVGRLPAL
jgi:hypothetical protein